MLKLQDGSRNGSLRQYGAWRDGLGISSTTAWRWRRRGWIEVITIAGRNYVSEDAIAAFERRAAAGEFLVPNQRTKAASLPGKGTFPSKPAASQPDNSLATGGKE